ncbi:MAG TPA: DUF960 domain-containing protein [Candidatus Paenibacillus intestinavium]|nr:DUF960 domain-containing protein [Candidatus Paenibacillus intestinavium]
MITIPRYITAGITNQVPLDTQLMLWELYETMQVESRDYLQIFELTTVIGSHSCIHHILHKQEEPSYVHTHEVAAYTMLSGKIYIVHDQTHLTMLWANEY